MQYASCSGLSSVIDWSNTAWNFCVRHSFDPHLTSALNFYKRLRCPGELGVDKMTAVRCRVCTDCREISEYENV